MATTTKGSPCVVFIGTSASRRLTSIHPSRLELTWPTVLSLAPAEPAVSVDELEDWIKRTNPVMMQLRPLSGTDEHNYGQLVRLLKEKGYVSRRCSR